jgi:choline kinase
MVKSVILAAGIGSRLGEITSNKPKCLIEIAGKSIIEHQIDLLEREGITDIIVVVGYHAQMVREKLKNRVTYVTNKIYEKSNSSYSLWCARDLLSDGWLHMNCDLLFSPLILKKMLKEEKRNAIAVDFDVTPEDDQEKVVAKDGIITKIEKRMPFHLADGKTIGMAKFSAQGAKIILHHLNTLIESGEKNKWFFSVISEVVEQTPFFAVSTDGEFWAEIDTTEDLQQAEDRIKQNNIFRYRMTGVNGK